MDFRRRPAEGLLTEHRDAPLQGADGLARVQGARRGDDDAVEIQVEEFVEGGDEARSWCRSARFCRRLGGGIGDRRRGHRTGLQHGLHAVTSDPPDAEKAQARTALD